MKRHFPFKRLAVVAGTVLLLVGVMMAALAWAGDLAASPAGNQQVGISVSAGESIQTRPPSDRGSANGERASRAVAPAPSDGTAERAATSTRPPSPNRGLFQETSTGAAAERAVRGAWQLARDAGNYRFITDLTQATYPARLLSNAGRGPQQQQALHMEGDLDVARRALNLRLWQGAGNVLNAANSHEVRVDGAHAYIRSSGGAWQATDDFSASFAPGNDLLAYLVAMKNVREMPAAAEEEQGSDPSRITHHASRFTFDVDGPAFAAYLRDQLEQQLREKGELPLSLHLDTAADYQGMTGTGEIWIDDRGLPLRLAVHLVYPEQSDGAHAEADVRTDFAGFPAVIAVTPDILKEPLAWADHILRSSTGSLGLASPSADGVTRTAGQGGLVVCSLGLIVALVISRRSRRVYVAIVIAVIVSMVIIPLLHSERVLAFFERQEQEARAQQQEQAAQAIVAEQTTSKWDPHRDPLAVAQAAATATPPPAPSAAPGPRVVATSTPAPEDTCNQNDTADRDGDGLNNYDECVMGTDPEVSDTDLDGLRDGQEVDRLGTSAVISDTDGDQIPDRAEVQGFSYAGIQWYLDPVNADTNGDGVLDAIECPPLTEGITITEQVIHDQCDADGDGAPNPFDDDNDDDGVPDRVDLSPDAILNRDGILHNGADLAPDAAYDNDHPFQLLVSNLQPGYPAFVDIQVRPVITTHLTYALNVLDWPTGDDQGQIQHVKATTFATSDNPDVRRPNDETGQYGDMRLVPLMEIEMTGGSVPLKLTDPAITMTVRGVLSATVKLTQQAANHGNTDLAFTFGETGGHDVKIYAGGCPASGTAATSFSGVTSGASKTYSNQKLTGLADAEHAMVITQGSNSVCTAIPNIINGPYTDKMVDASVLDPYGIGVLEGDEQPGVGRMLLAYLPLNLAPDASGGGRTAFQARMLYWPGSDNNTWTQAQQVRAVWAVQTLTDACDETGFPLDAQYQKEHPDDYDSQLDTWCAQAEHRTMDNLQIVQRYNEDWYLTGLSVREDHGLDVAVAYLDPAHYPDDEQDLWKLSYGLGQMFVTGRDCETDASLASGTSPATCNTEGLRDLTIFERDSKNTRVGNSTVAGRFDHADRDKNGKPDNSDYAAAKGWTADRQNALRWGIPAGALYVETLRYPHEDYLSYLSASVTPRVLEQFSTSVNPTLLFAHEQRYRSAGLAAASLANSALTVDINTQDHSEETAASQIWGTYRYNPGLDPFTGKVIGWEVYPNDEYYSKLGDDLQQRFDNNFQDDIGPINEGRVAVARSYYMTLLSGVTEQVTPCTSGAECAVVEGESDEELISAGEELADKINEVTGELVVEMMATYHEVAQRNYASAVRDLGEADFARYGDPRGINAVYEAIAETLAGFVAAPWLHLMDAGRIFTVAGLGVVVLGSIATIILSFTLGSQASGGALAARILLSVNLAIATLVLVKAVARTVKDLSVHGVKKFAWESVEGFGKTLQERKISLTVMVLVSVAVTWAAFGLEWGLGHLAVGSLAWNSALAGAIAGTITTVLVFVILTALGPLGEIIWAVMALVDSLVALICNAFLTPEQQESEAGQWLCGGITGLVANTLEWLFYSGTIMVDLNPDEEAGSPRYPRLQFSNFSISDLGDPDQGIVEGNTILPRTALTNTIDLAPVPSSSMEVFYSDQFNETTLTSSTFAYEWQDPDKATEIHEDLALGALADEWQRPKYKSWVSYTTTVESEEGITLTGTGLNQPVALTLAEGYAVPDQECWGVLLGFYCYVTAEKATNYYDFGAELVLDVLPATLDGFYTLAQSGTGWTLEWSQGEKLSFQVLQDADGDGLSYVEDPNDSRWDSDSDGLSDSYEQQTGSDPLLPDTDHEGLSDQDEAGRGTNPRLADSDGDGLTDREEVTGWRIVSGTASDGAMAYTWVTSDPLAADPDADGLTDFQERTFGYHPWVPSNANVLTLRSELREQSGATWAPTDGFAKPGAQLQYTATVKNQLDSRQAQGLLSTESAAVLNSQGVPPSTFVLQPSQAITTSGKVSVAATTASGVYSLTQVAAAQITDWQAIAGDAELWLRFDDAAGATSYADTSGSLPSQNGTCTGSGCTIVQGGRLGGAIQLTGSGYVHSDASVSASDYAISLWFKPDQDAPNAVLFTDLSSGQHRAWVYLLQGYLCAGGGTYEPDMCTSTVVNAKQWHHVVHTYGSGAGGEKLYLDGVLVKSWTHSGGATTSTANVNIGGSQQPMASIGWFVGQIDDVRLFDEGLTAADVAALVNEPVFHMDFNAQDSWPDVSGFGGAVSCSSPTCPAHDTGGIVGGAASFSGANYLNVGPSTLLDLHDKPFTLAAWVDPVSRGGGDVRDTFPQGILGRRSGQADASPTLQRVGKKIRFGMGTSAGWKSWTSPDDVLADGVWNHVAVTFDPSPHTVKLYVNGVLVGEDALTFAVGTPVAGSTAFDIGRSNNVGSLNLLTGYASEAGDGACGVRQGDYCLDIDGTTVFDASLDCYSYFSINYTDTFAESATLTFWEDDDNPHCGAAANGGDDVILFNDNGVENATKTFDVTQPGNGATVTQSYNGGSSGHFDYTYTNDSIPFDGKLDEVAVYDRALDAGTIAALASSAALYLPLDEPPGSTAFRDASMAGREASCTHCPTAGVTGRVNQAAWFQSAKSDYLALANDAINQTSNNLTVAAWINPYQVSGIHNIVATARKNSDNGWGFGIQDGSLRMAAFNKWAYTVAANLQVKQWYHVAAVLDASNLITFYVNGQPAGTIQASWMYTDPDDNLLVGAGWAYGSAGPGQTFDGQIDDVRVYRRALSAADIQAIYSQAPVLHLRFEDDHGATSFANNAQGTGAGSCTGTRCPTTGEAVRGQIGLAASFDGQDDLVAVPDSDLLDLDHFSIGAWINPTSTGTVNYAQELIGKFAVNNGPSSYDLKIDPSSLTPRLAGMWVAGTNGVTSSVPLMLNHWNHVMGTYDGKMLRMYVNGSETGSAATTGTPIANTGALEIGGWLSKAEHSFAGGMDEVVIYRTALSAQQVQDIFTYQAGWVQDRQSYNLTVDSDAPSVALQVADQSYLANQPTILSVAASDPTSGVAEVKFTAGSVTTAAPRCVDAASTAAWCPTFTPSGPGSYALKATATDQVGNATTSAVRTLYVDDSAPQVSIDGADLQRIDAGAGAIKPNTWAVHLSGAASDPVVKTGIAGSGVPNDGVRVTLRGPNGAIVGGGGQVAALSAGKWSLDYLISDASPSGQYTVTAEAVDQVARLPGLETTQVARHTGTAQKRIVVEADAPAVQLDRTKIASSQIGPATKTLAGAISDRLVPVEVSWTADGDAAKAGVTISCSGPSASYSPYIAAAGTFTAGQTYTWQGDLHRGSACHAALTTTAATGGVSGTVAVCGSQVASWTGSWITAKDVAFSAEAGACAPRLAVAGVERGEIAFKSIMPGSAYTNEAPLAGEVLHMPFDDAPDSSGNLSFRDIAGAGHTGTCSGQGCPTTGQAGRIGNAALFDGLHDAVKPASFSGFNATTVSAWVRRTGATAARETIVSYKEAVSCGFILALNDETERRQLPRFWVRVTSTGGATAWQNIHDDNAVPLNTWVHLVGTYDGQVIRLYRDGQQVASYNAAGSMANCAGGISVGAYPTLDRQFFPGLIDDVHIFNRALTGAEVKALYLGSSPQLELEFDEAWAAHGAVLPDSSGWGHDATLQTGTNDAANKAVTGQVGPYGLALDGVDDDLELPLDVSETDYALALWFQTSCTNCGIFSVDQGLRGANGSDRHVYLKDGTLCTRVWQNETICTSGTNYANGAWHQVVHTFGGSEGGQKVYVDGALKASGARSSSTFTAQDGINIGWSNDAGHSYFAGRLDDVRIYPRALPAEEVRELYLSGWQQATLNQHGAGVETSNWSASVPGGLEGVYEIALRGADVAGHAQAENARAALWRGTADTLAPRVTLHKTTVNATTYRYTTVAQDFDLAENSFTSPCGAGVITTRTYFVSPWYLAATGGDAAHPSRLYQLTADCQIPAAATEQATACDSFGNCATVGVTAAAEAPDASERPAAGPGVRITPALATAPAAPPVVSFATTVLTSTAYYEPRTIAVTGLVTGTNALAGVLVSIGGKNGSADLSAPGETAPYTTTWRFLWRLAANDPLPDGENYVATASATDALGHSATATATLTLDVTPPAPVTLTLTADGDPVLPGDTLRVASAEVALGWTAATDGSGLAPYTIAWSSQQTGTVAMAARLHDPAGPRADHFTPGQAQRLSVAVISRDRLGNERAQTVGPVYVDGPRTPDFVYLSANSGGTTSAPYTAWMDSGCTLMGTDRRPAAFRSAQRLYASWDRQALRLAWTGGRWNGDGDLFIYLDTRPGGTEQTFTPLPVAVTGTVVSLSPDLGADTLVWVQDAHTASLLRWTGSAWEVSLPLSSVQYQFNAALHGGQTDLYLPFDLLGLDPGASLGLLVFAAEEPAADIGLHLWATEPAVNAVNSRRVNAVAALAGKGVRFALSHAYRWPALGDDVCPNGADGSPGGGYADAEVVMGIAANPPGTVVGGRGSGVFWLSDPDTASATQLTFLQHAFPPVQDGQEVQYTVRYRNIGSQTAHGVWLDLSAAGPLRLLDTSVALGDIAPGAQGSATFRAVVDRGVSSGALAEVRGFVYDAGQGPSGPALDWLWTFHRVDQGAPDRMAVETPGLVVGPGSATLGGYAHDESGVAAVDVEVQAPSGQVSTVTCPVQRPAEGRWSCTWDVAESNGGSAPADGEIFSLRLAATDTFGHRSEWSTPKLVRVDARAPRVTLDFAANGLYTGTVRSSLGTLRGAAYDAAGIHAVRVCLDNGCGDAVLQAPHLMTTTWSYQAPGNGAHGGTQDFVLRTIAVTATDRLGNRLLVPLSTDVWVDNVAPVITATTAISLAHLGAPAIVLSGTVSDGGPQIKVSLRVQAPGGHTTRAAAARHGGAWWYVLSADAPGRYTFWADAEDLAGNRSAIGPFTVDVTCLTAGLAVTAVTAEPTSTSPFSFTLSAVIRNTGPDTIPAGMPVGLYVGRERIGAEMTAHGLAPGGSETVTTTWEVAGVGDYGVSVVLNAPDTGLPRLASAPALLPLCQTPATADAVISIRDMPLYSAWNLISPPVQPFVTDLDVVQRPISGTYDVILGYDGESRSYRPGRPPAENTLAGMDASHGYWIRTNLAPAPPLTDTLQAEPVATLRIAGQALPADKSLALAAGWNLVGYLPHPTLPVTTALQSIAGSYTAALGFEQTGLSYYPDLDARFNTLSEMTAASGYWIKASRTVTLTYPATAAVSSQAVTITGALAPSPTNRLTLIRQTEESAGVSPTFEWMNFYGTIALPDGSTAPTGTVVLAVDPQSVVCGATELAYPGQYGLLACYRDDPYTAGDEGAAPGDTIRLVISADGKQADGQVIGTGTWAAHGSRQQVPPPRSVPRAYLPVIWQGGQRAYESWLPLIMRILRTMAAEPPAQEPFDSPIPAPDAVGLPDAEKQKGGNP